MVILFLSMCIQSMNYMSMLEQPLPYYFHFQIIFFFFWRSSSMWQNSTQIHKSSGAVKTTYTFSAFWMPFPSNFRFAWCQQVGRGWVLWYISGALRRTYKLFYPHPKSSYKLVSNYLFIFSSYLDQDYIVYLGFILSKYYSLNWDMKVGNFVN